MSIPQGEDAREDAMIDEICVLVGEIIGHLNVERWWDTTIPDLNLRTPEEAVRDGDTLKVLELAKSYFDPSFA